MIKNILILFGKIIGWMFTAFFLFMVLAMLVTSSIPSAIMCMISALLCMPVNKVTALKRKVKINSIASIALACVLFVGGVLVASSPNETTKSEIPTATTEVSDNIQLEANHITNPQKIPESVVEGSTKPSKSEEQPIVEPPKEQKQEKQKEETPKTPVQEKPKEEASAITPSAIPVAPSIEEQLQVREVPSDSTFSIHYIDVGQADAALVECDGHYMLIDGGNKADSNRIYSVLQSAGANHLDMVVGTHGHEDHIGGLPGAYNYADVALTLCSVKSYDSDAFADFSKYAGNITVPKVGDNYKLGSADVKIVGVNSASDANNTSIVLKIVYGETSFLFTGDAEREAEQVILNSGSDLSSTILKVGHHGSDTSTTYPFLREIMPEYAIISVGKGNNYGHPTDATLSRLRDADITIFRTDLNGDIKVTSDGKTVTVSPQRTASNDAIMTAGSIAPSKPVEQPKPTESTKPSTPTMPTTPAIPPETIMPPVTESKPQSYTVIANKNSKAFHRSSCSRLPKEKNRVYFNSREAALLAGYNNPCDYCNP